jgi:hypothetical protein
MRENSEHVSTLQVVLEKMITASDLSKKYLYQIASAVLTS